MDTTIFSPRSLNGMTIPIEAVESLTGKKAWRPPSIKVLPYVKENYKGKNVSGGRKCFFTQSKDYKKQGQISRQWSWPYARNNELTKGESSV